MSGPLRVLVDATAIPADLGGVGRYLQSLVPELAARDDVELHVAVQRRDAARMASLAPGARLHPLGARWSGRAARLAWEQLGLPSLVRRTRAEVLHSPHYTLPLASPVPTVVTLHDATFFSHPQLHSRLKRAFFRTWTRIAVRRAAALVVPSRATGSEVRRFARLDPAKEHVAYHGVDTGRFHPPAAGEVQTVRAALDLPERWIAFLGTVEPRKNVAELVRAVAALDPAVRPALVVAGAKGWDEQTGELVASLPADVDVRLPGYLPIEQLPGLIGGAQLFVYPSLGEGFGLPVLEAMACGAPTVTTNQLALPEVGGDAVRYTGLTAREITGTLAELLADDAERRRLASAGPLRAHSFTWAASAEAHVAAYRAAAA